MSEFPYRTAHIIGAGTGISASVARQLAGLGVKVALAARSTAKLKQLDDEIGAKVFSADASDRASVEALFRDVDATIGEPDVVVFNASARAPGPVAEIDPVAVEKALAISAYGGFLAVHHAARRMVKHGKGAILLTGASASVKGFPRSSAFAMGKFALRGLAQSAARDLGPMGINVAHFVIDGAVRSESSSDPQDNPDSTLSADAIAQTYIDILRQHRSAWSFEVEVRPWVEKF